MPYVEPGLLAGWEPDAPLGDTAVRRFLASWVAANGAPVAAMGGSRHTSDAFAAADLGRPAGFFNSTTLLAPLGADTAEATMTAIDDFYGGSSVGEVLLFSAWPTPDLRPYGWRLEGHPPLMLRAPAPADPHPSDLEVVEVGDAAGLRAFEEVMVPGYPFDDTDPRPGGLLDAAVLADGRMRCWVGWTRGQPVGAAATFVDFGVNNVTMLATLPDHRRRGFGEALMWPATLADPDLPAMLLSSDAGRPLYERMGYVALFRFTVWHRQFDASE